MLFTAVMDGLYIGCAIVEQICELLVKKMCNSPRRSRSNEGSVLLLEVEFSAILALHRYTVVASGFSLPGCLTVEVET